MIYIYLIKLTLEILPILVMSSDCIHHFNIYYHCDMWLCDSGYYTSKVLLLLLEVLVLGVLGVLVFLVFLVLLLLLLLSSSYSYY